MKQTPLKRKTPLKRSVDLSPSGRLVPRSKRRAGMSREQHNELKGIHREIIMLQAGAFPKKTTTGQVGYYGPCEKCRKLAWLSVCHIEPQGQYPGVKYDAENAWAGCYRCHIHWWHKNPMEAQAWIEQKMGKASREALHMRAQTRQPSDYIGKKMYLVLVRDRLRAKRGE